MTGKEAVSAVYAGNLVECTKEEYRREVRQALQDFAGKSIDGGDGLRATIALREVGRLDQTFSDRLA